MDLSVIFESDIDCPICRAKARGMAIPHRPHHPRCSKNTTTRGKGMNDGRGAEVVASEKAQAAHAKAIRKQLTSAERLSASNVTQEALNTFMEHRPNCSSKKATTRDAENEKTQSTTETTATESSTVGGEEGVYVPTAEDFKFEVIMRVTAVPTEVHVPRAVHALASYVTDTCLGSKRCVENLKPFFTNITATVPPIADNTSALYDSIVGQELLVVDWELFFPSHHLRCPRCRGNLQRTRSNFSKNKSLFPIFAMSGPPKYAILMGYKCAGCSAAFYANDGELLARLPPYMAMCYPVEPKYARGTSHLAKDATRIMEASMVTYGNGDYISRMLYEGINTYYEDKTMRYYSYCAATGKESEDYVQKDGEFLVRYPPLGETIRQLYDDGASSEWQPWMVSDNERNTREIQGVRCQHMFAHDHTHQVVKNYPRRLNAAAMWTMATETGEIACAVLVHDTSALEFAHAAEQVLRRTGFCPKAMYSDTWPCGKDFWLLLVDDLEGRLGLFHFIQRITKTLRQRHIDFGIAMKELLDAIYEYHPEDLEKLVGSLKNGTMSSSKKQYTDEEISEMMGTKTFRQRYSKNLRKIIRGGDTIVLKLEEWKCKYKCTSTPGKPPARGRLDPHSNQPLFTAETHQALENCKEKAKFLADPLPVEKMYCEIPPSPRSSNQLVEYVPLRGESKLESFHDNLTHFANCGMRETLADALNLAGTAQYNRAIRHKMRIMTKSQEERSVVPAGWEMVVSFGNACKTNMINILASMSGASRPPFPEVEKLPEDTGERFFSEYLETRKEIRQQVPKHPLNDRCQCRKCASNKKRLPHDTSIPLLGLAEEESEVEDEIQQQDSEENPAKIQQPQTQPETQQQTRQETQQQTQQQETAQAQAISSNKRKEREGEEKESDDLDENNTSNKKQKVTNNSEALPTTTMAATNQSAATVQDQQQQHKEPQNAANSTPAMATTANGLVRLQSTTTTTTTRQKNQPVNPYKQNQQRPTTLPDQQQYPFAFNSNPHGWGGLQSVPRCMPTFPPFGPPPRVQTQFCCVKYMKYCVERGKGRPPHDRRCLKRALNKAPSSFS